MVRLKPRTACIAGRRYKDDPALFGWDLINEPRCNCFPEILPAQSEWLSLEASCNVSCADALSVRRLPACSMSATLIVCLYCSPGSGGFDFSRAFKRALIDLSGSGHAQHRFDWTGRLTRRV